MATVSLIATNDKPSSLFSTPAPPRPISAYPTPALSSSPLPEPDCSVGWANTYGGSGVFQPRARHGTPDSFYKCDIPRGPRDASRKRKESPASPPVSNSASVHAPRAPAADTTGDGRATTRDPKRRKNHQHQHQKKPPQKRDGMPERTTYPDSDSEGERERSAAAAEVPPVKLRQQPRPPHWPPAAASDSSSAQHGVPLTATPSDPPPPYTPYDSDPQTTAERQGDPGGASQYVPRAYRAPRVHPAFLQSCMAAPHQQQQAVPPSNHLSVAPKALMPPLSLLETSVIAAPPPPVVVPYRSLSSASLFLPEAAPQVQAYRRLQNARGPSTLDENARNIFAADAASSASTTPSAANDVPAEGQKVAEISLHPEQLAIVELAATGRNVFYTGSAGSGKSCVLHAIVARLRAMGRRVSVVAPTGQAAISIKGTTTFTFCSWTPDHFKKPIKVLCGISKRPMVQKRFCEVDTLIIDEISMVENLHFERINAVMKAGRSEKEEYKKNKTNAWKLPFGGVQMIVTGDFCQLPPVQPFQYCMECGKEMQHVRTPLDVETGSGDRLVHRCVPCRKQYHDNDKWAFRSDAWTECNFTHVHLRAIHRQNDLNFVRMLQKCRLGFAFRPNEVDLLMVRRAVTANAVKLLSTRNEVRQTNAAAFARLKTPPWRYTCHDTFHKSQPEHEDRARRDADGNLRALNGHRYDTSFQLKKGAIVVLLTNLDLGAGLCNGSQGIIAGFEAYNEALLLGQGGAGEYASVRQMNLLEFAEKQSHAPGNVCWWPIVKFHNKQQRTIMADCQVHEVGEKEPYSLMCRTQVPLAPAWALSIHKSQGLTLDRVVVNLTRAFEEGQVYVALSRVTSLEGLSVEGTREGLNRIAKGGNAAVKQFLYENFRDIMREMEKDANMGSEGGD